MGKTKWFDDDEFSRSRKDYRPGTGNSSNRRRSSAPGQFTGHQQGAEPIGQIFGRTVFRIRRNWIALRYRFNQLTLGAFQKRAAFKLLLLALAGYLLFDADSPVSGLVTRQVKTDFVSYTDETTLDVGPGEDKIPENKPRKKPIKDDASPVGPEGVFDTQAREYIRKYKDIAITEMQKYGIPASISLAQGLVESRAGTSRLAVRNNNHFGMKCFARNCKKGHCSNFTDDSHKDFFRIYASPWESWRAHSVMLSTGRYASLKKYGRDYTKWAYGLKRLGYATNRTYAEKLIGMIERYDLHKYDN
ncbi:MAG: glucosaminidase domain-containing protein [Saprospiraceae bacterium]|nr:glucosaminidase domain-containing protein [Saprospiraceae bacterium]